jgi:hypothetical protein
MKKSALPIRLALPFWTRKVNAGTQAIGGFWMWRKNDPASALFCATQLPDNPLPKTP